MEAVAIDISVIIPVYKVEKYIHACVGSILKQTFQNFEIILVDDGSPDCCPAICDSYAAADSRIKVVHKENAGLGFARNSGLDVARGRYVCFIDSDDYLELNTLEYCLSVADSEGADEVRFLFRRFPADAVTTPGILNPNNRYVVAEGDNRLEPLLDIVSPFISPRTIFAPSNASSCTAIYRRDIIERNGIRFYSEREVKSEDYIFNLDFGMVCNRIVYTDNQFYRYRHNPLSLTHSLRFDGVERAVLFSKFLSAKLESHGFPDSVIYSMGYTIGEMREYNRKIFLSNLPLSRKKVEFIKVLDNDYVKEIQKKYPVDRLPKMQQIAFKLHVKRCFIASYIVTRLRELWKD